MDRTFVHPKTGEPTTMATAGINAGRQEQPLLSPHVPFTRALAYARAVGRSKAAVIFEMHAAEVVTYVTGFDLTALIPYTRAPAKRGPEPVLRAFLGQLGRIDGRIGEPFWRRCCICNVSRFRAVVSIGLLNSSRCICNAVQITIDRSGIHPQQPRRRPLARADKRDSPQGANVAKSLAIRCRSASIRCRL